MPGDPAMKMKAVRFVAVGKPPEVVDLTRPEPGPG